MPESVADRELEPMAKVYKPVFVVIQNQVAHHRQDQKNPHHKINRGHLAAQALKAWF